MKTLKVVCILVLLAVFGPFGFAQEEVQSAKVADLKGDVTVKLSKEADWSAVKAEMILSEGAVLKTGADSWAYLIIGKEAATVEVKENSQIFISELKKGEQNNAQKTLLDLAVGKILVKAQKLQSEESRFEVKTPTSLVGIRGTTFEVEVIAVE